MAPVLQLAAELPVVRELAVVDDGDVVEGVGPVGMRRADVHVRFGRHARMPDGVGALEALEPVLGAHRLRIAQVLHQLQGLPEREDLHAFDIFKIVREALEKLPLAPRREGEPVPEGVVGGVLHLHHGDIHAADAALGLRLAFLDLAVDVEALAEILLFGGLEPHDVFGALRHAIDGEAAGIGAAMLERLEHRRHLRSDTPGGAAMDQPCNTAHVGRSFRSGEAVEIGFDIPLGDGGVEALPFVALVVREHLVHLSGSAALTISSASSASSASPSDMGSRLTSLPASMAS